MASDLYQYPELYDALLPAGAHLQFYLDLARQHPGSVLELACGTGQLAVPIAATSRPTLGIDRSAAMLATARDRALAAGASLELVEGDMRDFDLGREFGLIFIARNSLLHLSSAHDLVATFSTVKRHLAPAGVFAFDVEQVDRGTWYISTVDMPEKWIVSVEVRSIFPQELPLLLEAGGLHLVSRFGDLARQPFGSGSPRQVCLCRAAA